MSGTPDEIPHVVDVMSTATREDGIAAENFAAGWRAAAAGVVGVDDYASALSMALGHVEALGMGRSGDYLEAITDVHRELRALLVLARPAAENEQHPRRADAAGVGPEGVEP